MKKFGVKPSKGQSILGFFMGIIFIGIGAFVAIPNFGAFGILWTLFAVGITVINGINAFGSKGVDTYQITVDDDSLTNSSNTKSLGISVEERLLELRQLYDKGLIEKDEYEEKRKSIIEDL